VGDFGGGGICASGADLERCCVPENIILDCVTKYRLVAGLGGTSKGRFGVYRKFLQVGGHTLLGWDMF